MFFWVDRGFNSIRVAMFTLWNTQCIIEESIFSDVEQMLEMEKEHVKKGVRMAR